MKKILLNAFKNVLKLFYVFPVNKNRFFFTSYNGRNYSDSPKAISEYIQNKYKCEIYWECENEVAFEDVKDTGVILVKHNSLKYFYALLTSKFIVCNITVSQSIPYRKNQYIIDTWHGCGPKRIGKYVKGHNKADYKSISLFLNPCDIHEEKLRDEIEFEGEILNIGYPRNDLLFEDKMLYLNKVKGKYPKIGSQFIVLYAPTFRGDFSEFDVEINWQNVIDEYEKREKREVIILYRTHPMVQKSNWINSEKIIDVSEYSDMQELLAISDVLITDYSSSIWDAVVAKNPKEVQIYATDYQEYVDSRGFWLDLSRWPVMIATSEDEMIKNIDCYDRQNHLKQVSEFLKYAGSYEDGRACERVLELIDKWRLE